MKKENRQMEKDNRKLKIKDSMFLFVTVFSLLLLMAIDGKAADPSVDYPSRPIEYVTHGPGSTSIFGHLISGLIQKEKILNQPVFVTNKSGGGGATAMGYVLAKKGNPYILLNVSSGVYIITTLLEKLPYTINSFTPIANLAVDGGVLAVKSDSPFKTIDDLIDAARRKPKELNMGLSSVLGTQSMAARSIQRVKGVQWNIISFKSEPEAILSLLGGNIHFTFTSPDDVLEHERAGMLRVLLANALTRYPEFKNAPTIKEAGLGEPILLYRGVVGPPDIPDYAVKKLEAAFMKVSDSERFRGFLRDKTIQPAWMPAVEYGNLLHKLNDQWNQMLTEHDFMKKK
jgi:putative tricarboxylic transport membrane protein